MNRGAWLQRAEALRILAENSLPVYSTDDGPSSVESEAFQKEFTSELRRALADIDQMCRFDEKEQNPEHSMPWALRGRIRFILGYSHWSHDFKNALRFAPDSFTARGLNYLCNSELVVRYAVEENSAEMRQALDACQEIWRQMNTLADKTAEQMQQLEAWEEDLRAYNLRCDQLTDQANSCTLM
eukprot:TRINITY_DN1397_c0_g1_i1.p1 TRINITY_DN1397_c0_g1~~TRINITY_DN1397_c0_g1_i1.p1  ORF type:complete len:184 (-),score=34.67 TRINITY_DN1397_c0_g1_i1:284-835(-)